MDGGRNEKALNGHAPMKREFRDHRQLTIRLVGDSRKAGTAMKTVRWQDREGGRKTNGDDRMASDKRAIAKRAKP
jgi:hypothetical protein